MNNCCEAHENNNGHSFDCERAWEEVCCEYVDSEDAPGHMHDPDCNNYDGAPTHQWEVTMPPGI